MQKKTEIVDLDLRFEELEAMEAPDSGYDKFGKLVTLGGILVGIAVT
ncbi:daptide-type RiPP [Streptomyces sp. NPDC093707]